MLVCISILGVFPYFLYFYVFYVKLRFYPYVPKCPFLNVHVLDVYFIIYFVNVCVFIIVWANQPSSRFVGKGEICFVGILKSGFTTNICIN